MAKKHPAPNRPISACQRCRAAKLGCDRSKPRCSRCVRLRTTCTYSASNHSHVGNLSTGDPPTRVSGEPESPLAPDSQGYRTPSASRSPVQSHVPRRRDRAVISCARCRRHKVRCDRKAPCGRCAKLNKGSECVYLRGGSAGSPSTVPDRTRTTATMYADKKLSRRFRTRPHWTTLLQEIKGSLHVDGGVPSHPESQICPTFGPLSLSINFPFSSGSGNGESTASIMTGLPPKSVQESLVAHYMDTVERALGFLDREAFEAELEEMWSNKAIVSDEWLAQFLVILALGSLALRSTSQPEGGTADAVLPSTLLDGAEACLGRAPFMLRPTFAVIRTLCMAVIVKQIYSLSCHELDTCWPLVGIIVRLSMSMGLHVSSDRDSRRLWANVVYLDMKQSLTCGMPLLLQSAYLSSLSAGNTMGTPGLKPRGEGSLERILADLGDVLFRAIDLANCGDGMVSYDEVIEVESQIRHHLKRPEANPGEPGSPPYLDLEACTVDIFLRQILLALTSRFALHPSSSTLYPASHISSLESALAILSHQRTLYDDELGGAARFAGFFRFDFFTAAMTICCQLVRNNSALDMAVAGCDREVPRGIVVEALKGCRELWRSERRVSICNARAFEVIDVILRWLDRRGPGARQVGSQGRSAAAYSYKRPLNLG